MASSKLLLAFLLSHILSIVGSHAALPSQLYWKSKLPNTLIPKSIINLLQSDNKESTWLTESRDVGASVPTKETNTTFEDLQTKRFGKPYTTRPSRGNGVTVSTNFRGRPLFVGVSPGGIPFNYLYAAAENQLFDRANQTNTFFLQKDLQNGTSLNLYFPKHSDKTPFLSRALAKRIPFSSAYLPQMLAYFGVKPGSIQAQVIKNTIKECEEPSIKGEDKCCTITLESMVDFVVKRMGRNVQVMSTRVEREMEIMRYTIKNGVKTMRGNNNVVCHKKSFPCALFYCHTTKLTKTYRVPLECPHGTKVNAVAVCHTDTSGWNPKHMAFRMLKVSPGTLPICHFLPESHIVWVLK